MWKICAIGEKSDLEKNKTALKLSEFDVQFLDKDEFENASLEDHIALIVFPWQGYREIFNLENFKKHIDSRSVLVVGPAIYFFEIEEWVIDGSICFLSSPVNSMQIESVINEILRIRNEHQSVFTYTSEDARAEKE